MAGILIPADHTGEGKCSSATLWKLYPISLNAVYAPSQLSFRDSHHSPSGDIIITANGLADITHTFILCGDRLSPRGEEES